MTRRNYDVPQFIKDAQHLAVSPDATEDELAEALKNMTKRHNDLLSQIYRTVDNYSDLLQAKGPYHQVELGEPLSRFEHIFQKAHNDSH